MKNFIKIQVTDWKNIFVKHKTEQRDGVQN